MPYIIEKQGEKWVVKKRGGKHVFGRHDTPEEARAQARAIMAEEKERVEAKRDR